MLLELGHVDYIRRRGGSDLNCFPLFNSTSPHELLVLPTDHEEEGERRRGLIDGTGRAVGVAAAVMTFGRYQDF